MRLSILICTVHERKQMFDELYRELQRQALTFGDQVQILFKADNKQISVGAKRQKLLEESIGDYVLYCDDDDLVYPCFVSDIMTAIESNPDCVGIQIDMTTNGEKPQLCCHSLRYPEWANNRDGYDYVRNVTHRNPVKRELAIQVGFEDMRFGEDKKFSDRVTKLCQTEVFIDHPVFHYRYTNNMSHRRKYGIR